MFESLVTPHISFFLVFLEGILSFFSPCVIPLIPIYMGYLSGNTQVTTADGTITYNSGKTFFHTVCFVLGISFAFIILGLSFTALGSFFQTNQLLFTRIGGILIILLGLFQIGFFDLKFLQRERKINFQFKQMNPLIAFIMGFTFSFAWTPCVGPALSSVLIMASSAKNSTLGFLLIFVYALGFIIPFLLLGLFTTQVLNFLKQRQQLIKYAVKLGGLILILIGIMTFTGWMNSLSSYLNTYTQPSQEEMIDDVDDKTNDSDTDLLEDKEESDEESTDVPEDESVLQELPPAIDFTLVDQYGTEHTLSDYKGKVVFLNFWATWCPPCAEEMPDIESLYHEYGQNSEDVVFIGVANPRSEEYPYNQDVPKDEIIDFLSDNGYTFPTVFDESGTLFEQYFISAFPTTFMINKEGNIYGYVPGMLTKDIMENIINQTIESTESQDN